MSDAHKSLELANLVQSIADEISDRAQVAGCPPSSGFHTTLRKTLRDAANVSDDIEMLRVEFELRKMINDETTRVEVEIAKRQASLMNSNSPASNGRNVGTPNQPIYLEVPVTVNPVLNVPEQRPTKKTVTRSFDRDGEPMVTIAEVPADQ